nr:MAG TPA: hypothetical protein [Bacteriophage sp.]
MLNIYLHPDKLLDGDKIIEIFYPLPTVRITIHLYSEQKSQ